MFHQVQLSPAASHRPTAVLDPARHATEPSACRSRCPYSPALLPPGRGGPPAAVLRAALYGHAFNPARAGADPGPPAAVALGWASDHCLPLTSLADPAVTRRALEALALRLDGTRAAATTITRKRRLPRLPRLRGRTRSAGSQPAGPHYLAVPEIVLLGRPAVSGHTCRGAGDPGRGHPDPAGADRGLPLTVTAGELARCSSPAFS